MYRRATTRARFGDGDDDDDDDGDDNGVSVTIDRTRFGDDTDVGTFFVRFDFTATAPLLASLLHRLTQLCGTPCFLAAAHTPIFSASATTLAHSFFVFRLLLLAIWTSNRPVAHPGASGVSSGKTDGQMVVKSN